MANKHPLRGFATVSYYAADHAAAIQWYSELFGIAPYFNKPGYAEFRVGDYQHELGLIDAQYKPKGSATTPGGEIIYWHVDNIEESLDRLLELGATAYEPIIQRGAGFVTASVLDPFGNILGIMYNPHYLEVFNSIKK
ncbi:VOC family protein [Chitinophaga niabensis]|uniref:VOC domain-containing protein n=1 Tax=Chitinophaga niabensis TaxID=536979 RepID=A0A1N6J2T1_9BACT|nr:VOC family protein [Chitinophaga niabensis]SIO38519.1 hypothetical protein SAMN04488055_3575 [Chitinophaga niabensis]